MTIQDIIGIVAGTGLAAALVACGGGAPAVETAAAPEPTAVLPDTTPAEVAAPAAVITAGLGSWEVYKDDTATITVTPVPGTGPEAVEIVYNLGNTGHWCGIWRNMSDLSGFKGIKLVFRGSGASNTVEFKLEDEDGTNFGQVLPVKSNAASLTTLEIPFNGLRYFWGGDQNLNLKNVKMHVAISHKAGDEGGAGKITIDDLVLMP